MVSLGQRTRRHPYPKLRVGALERLQLRQRPTRYNLSENKKVTVTICEAKIDG